MDSNDKLTKIGISFVCIGGGLGVLICGGYLLCRLFEWMSPFFIWLWHLPVTIYRWTILPVFKFLSYCVNGVWQVICGFFKLIIHIPKWVFFDFPRSTFNSLVESPLDFLMHFSLFMLLVGSLSW